MWPPQRSSIWPGPGHLANGQPPQQHQPQRVPQHHLHHQPCMPPYGGGGAGAASPYQPPLLPDPTWQDVVLEQQFSHMSFRQPPPIFQQPPRPSTQATTTQQPQTLAHLSNNTPMTMSSAVPASNGGGGGIPSLLDIRVPRPPHLNNSYSRPPPPQAIPPPMAVFPHPMINTSVPPPRITVLQKPPRLAQRPVPVPSPSPIVQAPQILSKPTKSESPPNLYVPNGDGNNAANTTTSENGLKEPEMKVTTILKRPASTPSNLALNGHDIPDDDSDPMMNLRKREEEYEKMRLRILGSTGNEDKTVVPNASSS